MKFKYSFWLIAFVMLSISVSCSKWDASSEQDPIKQSIAGMTLKEKVCQMFILRPESLVLPDDPKSIEVTRLSEEMASFYRDYPAGGLLPLCQKHHITPAAVGIHLRPAFAFAQNVDLH